MTASPASQRLSRRSPISARYELVSGKDSALTDSHNTAATPGANFAEALTARWARLAEQPSPQKPAGPVGQLVNRILTYAPPRYVSTVLPHLDRRYGGLVLAGANAAERIQQLNDDDYDGPVLIDPAAYENYTATAEAPFRLPDGRLIDPTLSETLDEQLQAGASVALTPTGYIKAGDIASLRAAVRVVHDLGRRDVVFVAPIDVSLVDNPFIHEVTSILAEVECPIGLILGSQFDPLHRAPGRIIPNLRNLAVSVPLMPLRTDFNAFDLVAHGAFAGAIGTGGRLRHAVDPAVQARSWNRRDESPSVLFVELLCWWRGRKLADLYGNRPRAARICLCAVCQRRRPTRLVRRRHQQEAIGHAVAVWSSYVADMLAQPTMRGRATYWHNLCVGSVREHDFISQHLGLYGNTRLRPQAALAQWATLPPWPTDISA
jgi:hypothetical protein